MRKSIEEMNAQELSDEIELMVKFTRHETKHTAHLLGSVVRELQNLPRSQRSCADEPLMTRLELGDELVLMADYSPNLTAASVSLLRRVAQELKEPQQ